jgi:hypothetical protein
VPHALATCAKRSSPAADPTITLALATITHAARSSLSARAATASLSERSLMYCAKVSRSVARSLGNQTPLVGLLLPAFASTTCDRGGTCSV